MRTLWKLYSTIITVIGRRRCAANCTYLLSYFLFCFVFVLVPDLAEYDLMFTLAWRLVHVSIVQRAAVARRRRGAAQPRYRAAEILCNGTRDRDDRLC